MLLAIVYIIGCYKSGGKKRIADPPLTLMSKHDIDFQYRLASVSLTTRQIMLAYKSIIIIHYYCLIGVWWLWPG